MIPDMLHYISCVYVVQYQVIMDMYMLMEETCGGEFSEILFSAPGTERKYPISVLSSLKEKKRINHGQINLIEYEASHSAGVCARVYAATTPSPSELTAADTCLAAVIILLRLRDCM